MVWGADKPFLTKLAIRRWQARFPFWPPPDASPVTPIEPWGKQFFVYNAPEGTEIHGDPRAPSLDELKPQWVRDEDAYSMLQGEDLSPLSKRDQLPKTLALRRAALGRLESGPEPLLCATDFRQRPLMFLRKEEWHALLAELPRLKEELRQRQAEIDAMDQRGEHMKDYLLRRKFILDKYGERKIGIVAYGDTNRSYKSHGRGLRDRERDIEMANKVLERMNSNEVE
ncbi:unnamed protein product [Effrenium voratum]|nr:unnamed protein product [Effrenium voratum]